MKEFFKSALARGLGIVALALIGVMIYSATTGGFATIPETLSGVIVTPLQTAVSSVSNGVSDFFGWLTGGGDMRQQLADLEKENAELRQQLVDYDEIKQTNEWYSDQPETRGNCLREPDYWIESPD